MIDYFSEMRQFGPFQLHLRKSNALIQYKVIERWRDIDSITLKCGASGVVEISKQIGLSEKYLHSLEGSISGSIGLQGIAELKSEIKENTGKEVVWEKLYEKKHTITFKAPECGLRSETIYQLEREYEINYTRPRLILKETWTKHIIEKIDSYYIHPYIISLDKDCGCLKDKEQRQTKYDGLIKLSAKKTSLIVPFTKTEKGAELHFERGTFKINDHYHDVLLAIPFDFFPESFQFFEDSKPSILRVKSIIYEDNNSEGNEMIEEILPDDILPVVEVQIVGKHKTHSKESKV